MNDKLEQIKALFQAKRDPMSLIPDNMKYIFQGTQDYRNLFYSLAKQSGVNPQQIIDFLTKK